MLKINLPDPVSLQERLETTYKEIANHDPNGLLSSGFRHVKHNRIPEGLANFQRALNHYFSMLKLPEREQIQLTRHELLTNINDCYLGMMSATFLLDHNMHLTAFTDREKFLEKYNCRKLVEKPIQ